ncbi:MAG: phosphoribosyltransferase family protein [Promethearchaeia archaeon]
MSDQIDKFENRTQAGKKLAGALKDHKELIEQSIILAIPRGGVPVAYEVANELNIPFTLIITKKLTSPQNPEVAIGAIAPDGTYKINERTYSFLDISDDRFERIKKEVLTNVKQRVEKYTDRKELNLEEKKVIIIDDGIATGFTSLLAAKYARKRGADKVVLAVPVALSSSITTVKKAYDDVIFIISKGAFSIGAYYNDFHQNTDEELFDYIEKAKKKGLYYD